MRKSIGRLIGVNTRFFDLMPPEDRYLDVVPEGIGRGFSAANRTFAIFISGSPRREPIRSPHRGPTLAYCASVGFTL
jgi:hypothetical protein